MGLSTPRAVKVMAKYYISIQLSVKTTMEFSTRHFGTLHHAVQAGWNQLKPDQSSCSMHDEIGIVWLVKSLLLWTSTREVV